MILTLSKFIIGSYFSHNIKLKNAILKIVWYWQDIWVRYLGRSGYDLAKALGVTPQSLYVASGHTEGDDTIKSK
jgi:hypothetical protein